MVTAENYSSPRYQTATGFDGVVRISYTISNQFVYTGTGTLLYDGRAVLTAAHLFYGAVGSTTVEFDTVNGAGVLAASQVVIDPSYDPINGNNDLALVFLDELAPLSADRYQLYRASDEIDRDVTLVGFGSIGTGDSGAVDNPTDLRLQAKNTIDLTDIEFNPKVNTEWTPRDMIFADFDSGNSANDAFGRLASKVDLGTGASEGMIAQGDSGGPAFIDGQVAGVASYTTSISSGLYQPDVDNLVNSSFGEIGAWQRISAHQEWIDTQIRQNYEGAPTRAADVNLSPSETSERTFFMVQFNGIRESDQIVSVDYATRNGTAVAGEDYLAVQGRLNLYPNEKYALIPVELINDSSSEGNETFFLDVFNPVGGSFGGVELLTATRTIVDDDLWLG